MAFACQKAHHKQHQLSIMAPKMANSLPSQIITQYLRSDFSTIRATYEHLFDEALVKSLCTHSRARYLQNANEALKIVELAEKIAYSLVSPSSLALVAWTKGGALGYLNKYPAAIDCFQRAEAYYAEQGMLLQVAGAKINQIMSFSDMGDYGAALQLSLEARKICEAIGEDAKLYLAYLEMNSGLALTKLGDLSATVLAYERAKKLYLELGETIEAARIDINRAIVMRELGQFAEAKKVVTAAKIVLEEAKQDQEVARADLNLGVIAYVMGNYQNALYHLGLAYDGFARLPNETELAVIDLYRSYIYSELNLLREAIRLAERATAVLKKTGLRWQQALALKNQGIAYRQLQKYELADQQFAKARRLFHDLMAIPARNSLDIERAVLAFQQKKLRSARQIALRIQKAIDEKQAPELAARLFVLLAQCAMQGMPKKTHLSEKYIENARALAKEHSLHEVLIQVDYLAGQLAEETQDFETAKRSYKQAIETVENMRHHLLLDEFVWRFLDDKMPIYQSALRLNHRLCVTDKPSEALLQAANQAIDIALPSKTFRMDKGEQDKLLTQLRGQWHWYQSVLDGTVAESISNHPQHNPKITLRHSRQIEKEISDILRKRRERYAPEYASTEEAGFYTTKTRIDDELFSQLQQNEVYLQYYVVDGQCQVILMVKEGSTLFKDIAPEKHVLDVLRVWRMQTSFFDQAPNGRLAQQYLQQMHKLLIAPILQYLKSKTAIYLILPTEWQGLPFSAFFDGEHHLIEKFEITYLSALSNYLKSKAEGQKLKAVANHALLIGYSDQNRLPFSVLETQKINEIISSEFQTIMLNEKEATRESFEHVCEQATLIHLATHAVYRPDNYQFSWFRLHNGRITVSDLYEITLPARPLVILSACETGRGYPIGGGLIGLGRSFMAAGASGLVVSLWRTHDQFSLKLMTQFHKTHLKRQNPATALATAQREAIATGDHPFFWSPFVFISA